MRGDPGFFDVDERLKELSAKGDDLERLKGIVDFEIFRGELERAVPRSERAKGGRPPYDHVMMFKVLILQSSHSLSDERTEYLINDRLSFMRFPGLSLAESVPDANSIWNFREAPTRARIEGKAAIEALFERFDAALTKAGFLAMGGQIIDATIVAAPKRRNTEAAYRSAKNEAMLEGRGLRSQIHRKKPKGKPMPEAISKANGRKSKVRAFVEHLLARDKGPIGLVIRTIGLARAKVKIGLANLTCNMKRAIWLATHAAPA